MAKPTIYATPICIVLSILVIIGIIWGVMQHNPLIITLFLLPAVGYEAYRTEGESTRWASWAMLILILAELICIIFKVNFDLATYFNAPTAYFYGYFLPLSDIKVIFPIVMVFLSFILFFRTIGKYTKWLAVLLFISSIAIVYVINQDILKSLLHLGSYGGFYY
ncbi:MAG: hypothetical protein A2Y57_00795 [Candidatus Woykebacteria bacterium RBG_13_40_7b]|uniref:Uncharacterized protein n=1 Tax=Candidatus Woykebacteria bacterium RBG_13_40_7b TaxID=1802594 RepID=A0A1G1WAD8_9BACT|nr:MAG: hypothetical protein A2Y57_00795 [Candidatus Woykebacteria bacterium RBG_13_40_7b]